MTEQDAFYLDMLADSLERSVARKGTDLQPDIPEGASGVTMSVTLAKEIILRLRKITKK